jgi:hypothetical protein
LVLEGQIPTQAAGIDVEGEDRWFELTEASLQIKE